MKRINNKKLKKKKKKKFLFGKFLITCFFILIFILGVTLGIRVHQSGGGLQGVLAVVLGQSPQKIESLDTIYVLVMGVSEDIEKKLTDTIILCAYNPKQQTATMMSIPRDTFVGKNTATAKGSEKINSLYSKSPEKTMEAVSDITGINIDYYAVVNTNALIKIVDIIGGVEFEVPIDMKYDDPTQNLHINLKKGMQKIDGNKAEQLLRFRHSNPDKNGNMTTYPAEYGSDDYGRMRTQREFISATIKQTLQLKNITKIKELVNTVFENIETNLTTDLIFSYIPYVANFDVSSIDSHQLPGVSEKCNNIWFFIHDKKETLKIVENMQNKLNGIVDNLENTNTINENSTNSVKSS